MLAAHTHKQLAKHVTLPVLCMQIHTSKQLAEGMVYAYPYVPGHHLLELVAKQRGEPAMQELADDTSVDGIQHAANWEEVVMYLKKITMDNLHGYVPVLDRRCPKSNTRLDYRDKL